jgi:DNA repair ATPase RecN
VAEDDCKKCQHHEKNEYRLSTLETEVATYDANQTKIIEGHMKIIERLSKVEGSAASAHHRLDSMEAQTTAIVRLAMSVEHMSEKMDTILTHMSAQDERLNTQERRIDTIERAPGSTALSYWKMFVAALVTGIAGVIVGTFVKWMFK